MNYKIETFTGLAVTPWIESVSQLRIEIFREFPYLYEGNFEYEKNYMSGYLSDPRAVFVLVKDGNNLVGAATGMPLISDSDIVKDARCVFEKHALTCEEYYYFGEAVLLPAYRGKGLYTKLITVRERKAKEFGFTRLCFLAVRQRNNHPLKPDGFQGTDRIFEHAGFRKTEMSIKYDWPTIQPDGSAKNSKHVMFFWIKNADE